MNINTVSTTWSQPVTRSSSSSATPNPTNGPTDSVEPGFQWGEFRTNPSLMAGAGFVTTVGTGILGQVASAIHPVASVVVGGVAGAALGYNLLPAEAGTAEKVTSAGITAMLGAVCGYAGGNTNLATNAILAVAGAGGGFAMGKMLQVATEKGLA